MKETTIKGNMIKEFPSLDECNKPSLGFECFLAAVFILAVWQFLDILFWSIDKLKSIAAGG